MALMSNWGITIEEFTMTVDESRSREDAIEALAGLYVDPHINDEFYFSSLSGRSGNGKYKKKFGLCSVSEKVETDHAIREMLKHNYRSANLLDLFALGEINPNPQRKFTIIVSDNFLQERYIAACFTNSGSRHGIIFQPYQRSWSADCQFLGVNSSVL